MKEWEKSRYLQEVRGVQESFPKLPPTKKQEDSSEEASTNFHKKGWSTSKHVQCLVINTYLNN